ncbi:unnamed protein product, partial [marine sediment metagenome]
ESLGLSALRENPQLSKAALLKAQDMLENDYFAHRSPEGITGWYWIKKAGYNYQRAGENLAIAFLDSEEVHKAWNDSSLQHYLLFQYKEFLHFPGLYFVTPQPFWKN